MQTCTHIIHKHTHNIYTHTYANIHTFTHTHIHIHTQIHKHKPIYTFINPQNSEILLPNFNKFYWGTGEVESIDRPVSCA